MEQVVFWKTAAIVLGCAVVVLVIVLGIVLVRYKSFKREVGIERYINYSHID